MSKLERLEQIKRNQENALAWYRDGGNMVAVYDLVRLIAETEKEIKQEAEKK